MANIRIDTDGLDKNITDMRSYINDLDNLTQETQNLLAQIRSSWEGASSEAYTNAMQQKLKKAQQMKQVLQEFLSYMESARSKFSTRDRESAHSIRAC